MVGLIAALATEGAEAATVAPNWFVQHAYLIPLLCFASAALTLFVGSKTPGKGSIYGILAIGVGLVLSIGCLVSVAQGSAPFGDAIHWFTIGPFTVDLGIYVDGLTAAMLVVVTGISLMVHIYATGYMHGDSRYTWFYFVLSLFTAAMLVVVLAPNLFELLVGWEIMGVCSYLLIGHWYEDHVNSSAAIKAFITTRVGDVPFMFGIFACILIAGGTTSDIQAVGSAVGVSHDTVLVTAAALLLFGGTIGKSAQFPLHVWLPDAMAGPTPVSALIHAATMVAAGVYLVGRMFEVFIHADPAVLTFVSIIAAITMLGAALLAIVQDDIKRVLAYSTLSQLAYMVAGLSMGEEGFTAGFFHLFTHAFFKGLLFLGAGSVIHAVHSNNMSDMGGLKQKMPITFWTMLVGSAALAGFPLVGGFWSKDELLVTAQTGHMWLFVMFLATALITAYYTTRMVLLTFFGDYKGHAEPHESPPSMTVPLVVLAIATVVVGFFGAPQLGAVFGDWVHVGEAHAATFHGSIALTGSIAALLGIAAGYAIYKERRDVDPMEERLGVFWRILQHRYYIDDFYMAVIVLPVRDRLSAAVYWFNQNVLDGLVN
ncbi:MAG: NADH-quinone oxidoreductase subunit L, partial [Actinomycetota bacterium]|nr:NADH-quinone oxidoreductase subunit L [Actinomycetota bacterium]